MVVVLASALLCAAMAAKGRRAASKEVRRETEIPTRTLHRWSTFWQGEFPRSPLFEEQRGHFMPPLETASLPASLMARLWQAGRSDKEVLVRTLCFVSPLTTGSVRGGARYVRLQ
jgi:hypothetical protein